MTPAAATSLRFAAQRLSAIVLAVCVLVHLVTIVYATRHGLSAAAIVARVRSGAFWPAFYAVFVAAVAVHAPLGVRVILDEWSGLRGRGVDVLLALFGGVLLVAGGRAVWVLTT